MKKVSLVIDKVNEKNKIFETTEDYNSINYYWFLKEEFKKNGYDLSTNDINIIEESDVIIYNDMPKKLPKRRDIAKSYLVIFESEVIIPQNWNLINHKFFNKIFTWKDDIVDNITYFKIFYPQYIENKINKDLSSNKKLCTLIAGNKVANHGLELYGKKREAIRWFESNHLEDFDFYGVGWHEHNPFKNKYARFLYRKIKLSKIFKSNFLSYKGQIKDKKEILEKYKFCICYENARDIPGYITEKIFDCFFAVCIQIYWRANNITDYIPKNCFIDKRDFDSYDKLYYHISTIKNDDYLYYLNNIEIFLNSSSIKKFSKESFATTICEAILKDLNE